jgi:hypothetical protein
MSTLLRSVLLVAVIVPVLITQSAPDRGWPAIAREARPWTRWWWHGSAVERASLTKELEALRAAGIGGVEITPIYGVRGTEDRFLPYLSDRWVEMLEHTLRDAQRLGMGVDMATGTGWPFGGPWVDDEIAPRTIAHRIWKLEAGQRIDGPLRLQQTPLVRRVSGRPIPVSDLADPVSANPNLQDLALDQVKYPRDLPIVTVVAYGDSGTIADLTSRVDAARTLDWQAAERSTVYVLFAGWHGKLVERAAPGGEGNVIDHFSRDAIRRYLSPFDRALDGRSVGTLRAFFNDSYEVDDAAGQGDWTPLLFDEFNKRRGYDLRRHLPALFGRDTEERNTAVLVDFRETISDLLLDTFTAEWGAWARRRGSIIRNQAHGSPANILDLYAASDIPETEGNNLPRFKWAASAANVSGRRLVAAEAATWLGEHFRSTLADVRSAVDHFFVAGVNHVVYHGTAYSPAADPWPGWQFYASVEFNPQNAWWDDFGVLNAYVARVQSFLQSGRADHDVLLYFPFRDALAVRGSALLAHFGGAEHPTAAAGFEAVRATLQARGVTYDYISDRQLRQTVVDQGRLVTEGGSSHAVLVVPPSRFMPDATAEQIRALERTGAKVVRVTDPAGVEQSLVRAGVARERMVDTGLQFTRRSDAAGRFYFIANRSDRAVDDWVPINLTSAAATIFDPMHARRGHALVRGASPGALEVYLQLPPGEALIVAAARQPDREPYRWWRADGTSIDIRGPWQVRFTKGGPTLPAARTVAALGSWTTFGGDEVRSFAGTATYATTFARPVSAAAAWQLDLGRLHESARVRLNGREIAALIGPTFRVTIEVSSLMPSNTLEVSVTNLSANRVADLDRRGVQWKKFYNINFPPRLAENRGPDGLFTAAKWPPLDSGLLGPVTLTPMIAAR